MAEYTYLAERISNNDLLGELELLDVRFAATINGPGDFSASVRLTGANAANVMDWTEPGKIGIWVARDGLIIWGGIIWDREYNSDTRMLKLSGASWESYFFHRRAVPADAMIGSVTAGDDQLVVAIELLTQCDVVTYNGGTSVNPTVPLGVRVDQTDDYFNVAVSTGTGVARDLWFYPGDTRTLGDVLTAMALLDNGFDWAIDSHGSFGSRYRDFNMGYPRGRTYGQDGFVFAFDVANQITKYTWKVSAANVATFVRAIGAGTDANTVYADDSISPGGTGFPRLDYTESAKQVSDSTVLAGIAASRRASRGLAGQLYTFRIRTDRAPFYGWSDDYSTWLVGDTCSFNVWLDSSDPWAPYGFNGEFRVLKATFYPGTEEADLVVGSI